MSRRMRYAVTPPGTPIAREYGCTCPAPSSDRLERAEDCPLHTRRHSFASDRDFRNAEKSSETKARKRGVA